MTKAEAIKILSEHNNWRRGGDMPMINPRLIGFAIDKAIEVLKQKRKR